ncbi:hypothetical protein HIM_04858 [Hirsutella minnesotensis 3608]|uniref:Zn(2)-C6 fungal-type domain-containing protein n=1 Tax=Hirsutella minnesotensis 3608 TaxID=1043627 RepID=A0A0F7ZKW4_9HYPO|nr:hypothetical protein HIM_04858 [Hirsutella minnesotensis 3608]
MAYGGKPSKGCQMCRIRRIKCDETRPTCKQCEKGRRQCPGYRGVGENQAKARPAATSRSIKPVRSPDSAVTVWSSGSSDEGSSPPLSPARRAIPAALRTPVHDAASCHFVSNYILIPRQGLTTSRGWLEFLVPILKQDPLIPHFEYAFNACALASLNNQVGTGNDFESKALGFYTKALAATFSALKDPEMVKHDATLASILLLSLFESITAKSLGMFAWSSHIEGAVELVKARGAEQLKTKTGMDLFVAVRIQMIIHALSTGKAPDSTVEWWVDDPVSNRHSTEFQRYSSQTAQLKYDINQLLATSSRNPESTALVKEYMTKCQNLDKEFQEWIDDLPEVFHWETVYWEDYNPKADYSKAEAFPGRVDVYGDLWVVNMWNVMRSMRLVLASLIIRAKAWIISPADYRTTPEYAASSRTCGEAITDIIASVPYQLGFLRKRTDIPFERNTSSYACGQDDTNKSLAGFFAIWPLVCVQNQDFLTDLQRTWVKGRLKVIGNELGVRYANMFSQQNLRSPSMLILSDRLKSIPPALAPGMRNSPEEQGETESRPQSRAESQPMSLQNSAYRKIIHDQTEQLKKQAVEKACKVDDWTVRTWLQL